MTMSGDGEYVRWGTAGKTVLFFIDYFNLRNAKLLKFSLIYCFSGR